VVDGRDARLVDGEDGRRVQVADVDDVRLRRRVALRVQLVQLVVDEERGLLAVEPPLVRVVDRAVG